MMAQAYEVYYLPYVETDLGSPITLYLQVPTYLGTYKSTSSICKAVVQYLASYMYTTSEDCTNVQAKQRHPGQKW